MERRLGLLACAADRPCRVVLLVVLAIALFSPPAKAQSMLDTLEAPSLSSCGTVLQSWRSPFGFVFGNNSLGDREKLQRLVLPELGNGFVTAVRVRYDHLSLGSPSGSIRCVAYAVGTDGAPGAFLKASDTLTLSSLPGAPGEAWFAFPEAAAFTDAVYVGIDLRFVLPGDSIGVPGTEDGCGSGCWPYETWSDGTRNPICNTYDLEDVDFAVAAAVDWSPRISGFLMYDNGIPALALYPNPAADHVWVQLPENRKHHHAAARDAAVWHWEALDPYGRTRAEGKALADRDAGMRLDLSEWPKGCYRIVLQPDAWHGGDQDGVDADLQRPLFSGTVCKP